MGEKECGKHNATLVGLRRIEGQVRGIQKMIENEKYCMDIVNQIYAVIGALKNVGGKVFAKHLETCVLEAFGKSSGKEKETKIDEIIKLFSRMNKL